jgi:hypothetical protein
MVAVVPVAVETVVRAAAVAVVVSNGLPLLPSGLLRLLDALGLLALLRLLALRLRLALHLLLPLRLRLALRLLGALRLCFLCVLGLLLVLRRLRFSSASPLFLFAFLCERRDGGCEK